MAATIQCPLGEELLVAGYFNATPVALEGHNRDKTIAMAMETEGLEDISAHFLPCYFCWTRDGHTWSMIRCRQEVRYLTRYILGKDHRLL